MQPSVSPRTKLAALLAVSVAAVAFAVGGAGGYAIYEHRMAENALAGQQHLAADLKLTQNQLDQLTGKLNSLEARSEPQPQPGAVALPPEVVGQPVTKSTASRRSAENSRVKKMQSQLERQGKAIDEQGKAIASTQSQLATTQGDLSSTRTELTGSIARNHDELVLLQKKGERNYYEFDIAKSKEFSHEGPLGVRLRKANTKHLYADLDLIVEDQTVSQKHVNLYQPAMFYMPGDSQAAELVINSITKDRIHGYVSAPKYRRSELASAQNQSGTATGQTASPQSRAQAGERQTLPKPQ